MTKFNIGNKSYYYWQDGGFWYFSPSSNKENWTYKTYRFEDLKFFILRTYIHEYSKNKKLDRDY